MRRENLGLFLLIVVAWSVQSAPAIAQDPPKGLVKHCQKGDAESCYYVGLNQSSKNPFESRRYFSLACGDGYRKGCIELFEASKKLLGGADEPEAVRHFEAACGKNHGRSCTAFATALWDGTSVTIDQQRAASLWQKGCELKSRVGCRQAGSLFEKGEVVAKNLDSALAFYQKSCDLDLESACAHTGRLLLAQGRASEAAAPLRKACLETNINKVRGDACLNLGQMLAEGNGLERDAAEAFEAFHMGCRDNSAGSCVEAGRAAEAGNGHEPDHNAALHFFGKGCDLKSKQGCEQLCRMQCDMGYPDACERFKEKKWPMLRSCILTPVMTRDLTDGDSQS